ncbi:MAG: ArsC/Spx/MgsR family protein [Litorivicinus sp.]
MSTTTTLYHNPRCSKSRQAKALLDEAGADYSTCLYLKANLTADDFEAILRALGGEPRDHLRRGEDAFKALPADAGLTQIAQALAADPIMLERPVLISAKGAAVCRPPERVLALI